MLTGFFVAIFGALGALARWGVSKLVGTSGTGLPWATLWVNGLGSLLLGLLAGWCLASPAFDERWRLALATGFLGSFTTFSTFSVETIQLVEGGRWGLATANVMLQVGVGLTAAATGFFLAKSAFS